MKDEFPEIWLHVDAAWAGAALACPELRARAELPGINAHADSLCVNFHKVRPAGSRLGRGLKERAVGAGEL